VQKTFYPKAEDVPQARWVVVDAAGQNLGRLATRVAQLLLGKHKPVYTPGVDVGDFVVVINAAQISVTGNRLDEKLYTRHSGYPGGLKQVPLREMLRRFPDRVIEAAVWGMLPRNRLRRKLMRKLKVYAGADHPHAAQRPEPLA
jgi:large subunit ribosomal protein L13